MEYLREMPTGDPVPTHKQVGAELTERPWHLDHAVPLALVLSIFAAILVQTASILWWASGFQTLTNARLASLEAQQKALESIPVSLARAEARSEVQLTALSLIVTELRADVREHTRSPSKP